MSKGFYDFDSDAEHWTEMFEQAQNLGFNPLLPADNFPPRIFGLRSLHLDKEKNNGSLRGDWYFAPKNNPVELVMDYFMRLVQENTKEIVRAFAYFTAQVIEVLTPEIEIVAVIFSPSANLSVVLLEPEFIYLTNNVLGSVPSVTTEFTTTA